MIKLPKKLPSYLRLTRLGQKQKKKKNSDGGPNCGKGQGKKIIINRFSNF